MDDFFKEFKRSINLKSIKIFKDTVYNFIDSILECDKINHSIYYNTLINKTSTSYNYKTLSNLEKYLKEKDYFKSIEYIKEITTFFMIEKTSLLSIYKLKRDYKRMYKKLKE